MDIGTLTGEIELEDQLSDKLTLIAERVRHWADEFQGRLKPIALGVAAVASAVALLATGIVALGSKGSVINGVEEAFDRLARAAGSTGEAFLAGLNEGVKGTVDSLQLMQSTMRLLSSGVKLSADDMKTMGAAARAMGKATGTDAAGGLQTLSSALLTGRTRALSMAGIVVNLKEAEEKFAASLGITRDALNEAGKLEAHRIGMLDAMRAYVDRLGVSQLSFKERLQQANVAIGNWFDNLAKGVDKSPAVARAFDAIEGAIAKAFGGDSKKLLDAFLSGIDSFANFIADVVPPIIIGLGKVKDAAIALWNWLSDLSERLGITGGIVAAARTAWNFLTGAFYLVRDAVNAVIRAWQSMPDWLQRLTVRSVELGLGLTAASYAIGAMSTPIKSMVSNIDLAINIIGNLTGAIYSLHSLLPLAAASMRNFVTSVALVYTLGGVTAVLDAIAAGLVALVGAPVLIAAGLVALALAVYRVSAAVQEWQKGDRTFFGKGGVFWDNSIIGRMLGMSRAIQEIGDYSQAATPKITGLENSLAALGDSAASRVVPLREMNSTIMALAELGALPFKAIQQVADAIRDVPADELPPALRAIQESFANVAKAARDASDFTDFGEKVRAFAAGLRGTDLKSAADVWVAAVEGLRGKLSGLTSKEIAQYDEALRAIIDKERALGNTGLEQHYEKIRNAMHAALGTPDMLRAYALEKDAVVGLNMEMAAYLGRIETEVPRSTRLFMDMAHIEGTAFEGITERARKVLPGFVAIGDAAEELLRKLREIESVGKGPVAGFSLSSETVSALQSIGMKSTEIDDLLIRLGMAKKKEDEFNSGLEKLSTGLTQMAQVAGKSFGNVLRGLSQIVVGINAFRTSVGALHQSIDALGKAKSLGETFKAGIGAASSILGMVSAGISIGSAIIKGIASAFVTPEWKKIQKDIGRDLGVTITEELARTIEGSEKEIGEAIAKAAIPGFEELPRRVQNLLAKGIGKEHRVEARVLSLDQIIEQAGGINTENIDKFTAAVRDAFVFLDKGTLTAAQATSVLDKNFKALADHYVENGQLISKQLLEIISLNDRTGTNSKAINEFVTGQVKNAVDGISSFLKVGADAGKKLRDINDELAKSGKSATEEQQKQIDSLQKTVDVMGVSGQAAASGFGAALTGSFLELIHRGASVSEAVAAVKDGVQSLAQQLDGTGLTGGAAFERLQAMVALASDEIAGPAIDGVNSLGQSLMGLHNAGILNQEMFGGLTTQIADTFNSLVVQGYDGTQALALMQPTLQTIWELQTDFGLSVDDTTQAMLDQAAAQGLIGEGMKDTNEKILDVLTAIAKVLGADLPASAAQAKTAMDKLKAPTDVAEDSAGGLQDAMDKVTEAAQAAADKYKDTLTPEALDSFNRAQQAAGEAGGLIHSIFDDMHFVIPIDFDVHSPNINPGGGYAGGLVTTSGITPYLASGAEVMPGPRGTDTAGPFWLTPGERVLSVSQNREYERGDSKEQAKEGETMVVNLTIPVYALDAESVRTAVTKPGGIADLIIDETSRDKRGRGTRMRRGLQRVGA